MPDSGTPEQQLATVVELLATGPMCPAQYMAAGHYEADDWRHYALNIPYYTHFTSPIRRYADVMVHRLLTASLGKPVEGCPEPVHSTRDGAPDAQTGPFQFHETCEAVEEVCDNCNERKRMSKQARTAYATGGLPSVEGASRTWVGR